MRLQYGTKRINERSVSQISVTFLGVDRTPGVPASARYRIDDVSNGDRYPATILDWTAIETPGASETLTVTAEQNRILNERNAVERRIVTVEATGSDGEPWRQAFEYEINNLPGS